MKNTYLLLTLILCATTSTAQTWSVIGNTPATTSEVSEFNIAINSDEEVCLGFVNEKGSVRASARIWDGTEWDYFGVDKGMSASTVDFVQADLSKKGRFFLLYRDIGLNNGTVVRAYDEVDDDWDFFGNQSSGVTGDYTDNLQLALDTGGNPYIGLQQRQFGGNFALVAYNPATRDYDILDNVGPTGKPLKEYTLAFSPSNELYIAYQDTTFANERNRLKRNRLTIRKWVDQKWELVGAPSISDGLPQSINLEFDSKGTPYVAYVDNSSHPDFIGYASTVRYFDGNSWKPVGPDYFYAGYATYLDLKVSPEDTLVVAYSGFEDGGLMNAYAYNGTEWQKVAENSASAGGALWNKIEFSPNGTLYAVYKDMTEDGKATVSRYSGNLTSPSEVNSVINKSKNQPSLYPNPSKESISIANLPVDENAFMVKDIYGYTIREITYTGPSVQLSISDLIPGTYFIQFSSNRALEPIRFAKY